MNKFKKLLSVLLAVVMALSCLTIMGSAYQAYENPGDYFYDSNDNPRSYLYTDEQRFSFLADMINDLLAGANINISQNILIATIKLDARSLDALFDSLEGLSGWVRYLGGLMGVIGDLDLTLLMDGDLSVNKTGGPQEIFETLVEFLGVNADQIGDILESGELDLGLIGSFVDVSAVADLIGDLPSTIGGLLYGLSTRKITNGIGSDPKYPNSAVWEDLDNASKPNFDTIVNNLIFKLLTEPNNTMATADPERNEIITNPEKYGATAAMIHQEAETGLYYIYGTQKADGTWVFTADTTTADGSDKNYISQWDDNSALIKGKAADELKSIINLTEGDLYTMLEKAIPWAYNTFAAHNLDAQLRATLMQFCGAYNNGNVDEATKETLKAKMDAYKEIEKAADGDKKALRDAFAAEVGAAGNVNFMYIDLEGKEIGDKTSDSLYYVVEWGGSYQYYHVEQLDSVNALFDLIDWEWQAPMWEDIASAVGLEAGQSILLHINDIVGTILKTAMPTLNWTAGTADNTLVNNLVSLMKVVVPAAKAEIWGEAFELPADFNDYNLEQAIVMIAGVLLDGLMPQLVLPEDVSSVEEIGAYALREFMAEIMPDLGAGWDAKFDAAKALSGAAREDAFLDVVLNMGTSTGAYYLKNLIGLGTVTDGANNTTVEAVPMGADYSWQDILNYIIDWVVKVWIPDIGANIKAHYPSAWEATDASAAGNPLLKLSAALSMLLPDVVRLLGAEVDGYAINLQHVYDDLRLAFNGDFSELGKGLLRKDASANTAGTMTAMKALANILTNLFGGILGFNNASRWSELQGVMDTAAASATPLTTLLGSYGGNAALATLVRPLLACLSEVAVDVFLYDAITIVTSFLGGLTTTLTNSGVVVDGVESAYTGATSFEIVYTFEMTTSGVKTYFNNGRYKTTAGAIAGLQSGFDGDFSMKFIEAEVVDANGNRKGYVDYNGAVVAANEKATGAITFSGVTEKIEVYTLETRYQIIAPDGTAGEVLTDKRSFTVTSLVNDALSATHTVAATNYSGPSDNWHTTLDAGSCGTDDDKIQYFYANWTINTKNIYISEVEALTKAATPIFSLTDKSTETATNGGTLKPGHTWTKVWVADYGYNTMNDDGSISITDGSGASKITVSGAASSLDDTWFKWAGNENALNSEAFMVATPAADGVYNLTSAEYPIWVAATNVNRADFTDNYYQYKITVPLSFQTTMGSNDGTFSDGMDVTDLASFTTYITLYNSYDLQAKLDAALAYDEAHYDLVEGAAAWAELQAAIEYANLQMYGAWDATKFEANHTANITTLPTGIPKDASGNNYEGYTEATVSTFKYAGDRLEVAMAAMADYVLEVEEEVTIILPSDPSSDLYPVYQALKAVDEKGYKSHNYVGYRWFKFSDDREAIRAALNAATPPSGVANDVLLGVDLDNAGIQGVIEAIDNDALEAIVKLLVEHPTQEAIDAAAQALADFAPVYDVSALMMQVQDMQTNERRLISKYDSQQKYFLDKSLADFGNEAADAYTAESYANYVAARAEAQEVNASGSATQYEIFSARYNLQVAYNDLVPTEDAVDLTAIAETATLARDILSKLGTADAYPLANDEITEEEAYKQLVSALGYEVTYDDVAYMIGGGNTAEVALKLEGLYTKAQKQDIVNAIDEALVAAVANFKAPGAAEPSTLVVRDDFEYADYVVIDTNNTNNGEYTGIVYGIDLFDQNMYMEAFAGSLADALTTNNGDDYLVIEANEMGMESTGATITVIDENGDALETYVFIYFGDIDGDGMISGNDSYIASEYEITYEGINSFAEYVAADLDGDGMPSGNDGYLMGEFEVSYSDIDYQYNMGQNAMNNYYEWMV